MMQVTLQTTYAVRCMVYLKDQGGGVVPIKRIASDKIIPAQYLSKIVQNLRKHGLTRSARGLSGGIALARAPEDISLYDVLKATSGTKTSLKTPCAQAGRLCPSSNACRIRKVWTGLDKVLTLQFRATKLSQL